MLTLQQNQIQVALAADIRAFETLSTTLLFAGTQDGRVFQAQANADNWTEFSNHLELSQVKVLLAAAMVSSPQVCPTAAIQKTSGRVFSFASTCSIWISFIPRLSPTVGWWCVKMATLPSTKQSQLALASVKTSREARISPV